MGISKKVASEEQSKETILSSKRTSGQDPLEALLQSLLQAADKADASALHIYFSLKSNTCYFEVGGKLELTGKKLSNKVLEELLELLITTAHLEKSTLNQAQNAKLRFQDSELNLTYIQNSEGGSSHLIVSLKSAMKPKSFEDLGLWGKSQEELEEVLDSGKGLIIVDSKDQYTLRSFISSSLRYLGQDRRVSSISFDSSSFMSIEIKNHDRLFTKINPSTAHLVRQALASNPAVVIFLGTVSGDILPLALEQSRSGKLVFLVTSEGSSSSSLQRVLSLAPQSDILQELKLVTSLSPVQTVASSNGKHKLDEVTIAQLEQFFGVNLPESWRSIYSHAGIKSPEELLHLEFPVASEYGGVTNLVEVLVITDYIKRTLTRNPNLDSITIDLLAARSGMLTKREDGLIKALRKEVDLADVIDVCK